jgi:DNA-binding transcriptional ArsR family regulator
VTGRETEGRAGAARGRSSEARLGGVSEPGAEDRAGAVFGALSDPTRRALLSAIAEHPAATATELASRLPISRQAVLKHLNALTDAGLLDRTRAGREVRYQFTPAPLSDAVDWMTAVGAEWDDRLAVLRRQLGGEPRAALRRSSPPVQPLR